MSQSKTLLSNLVNRFQVSNFIIISIEEFFKNANKDDLTQTQNTDFYTLIVLKNSAGKHTIEYEDYKYNEGSVIAIRKNQNQQFHINKSTKGYLILFKEEFLHSYLNEQEIANTIQMFNELITSPKTQFNKRDFDLFLNIIEAIEKEFLNRFDSYSLKIIRSLLHMSITQIHRVKSKGYKRTNYNKYLKEFIKFQNLVEQYYKVSKKVAFYSNKLGFSSKKLNTIVNNVSKKNAKGFIDDVIIIKAKKDLLNTNLSVKQIAYKLGFKDPANFFKYFRNTHI
ncbi:MAG: helix-turn-helix domain-containing protein [Flavobacteriaceae bacterium]|nr:helix-turn-helix domain-containing protein [Flavobacteriaceae bacterium]